MVDAIAFANLEVASPFPHGHGYMTRQGEHAGIVLSSEEGGVTVNGKLGSLNREGSYAEGFLHLILSVECDVDAIEVGMALAPQLQTIITVDNPRMGVRVLRLGNHLLSNHITEVTSPRDENKPHLGIFLERTIDIHRYQHLFPLTVGSDEQILDMRRIPLFQVDPSDDSIPVGLGVLGIGMRITDDLWRNGVLAVVHHHSDVMESWFQLFR